MNESFNSTSARHINNTIIATDPGKEKYDATLKELMSNRQFLSRILKRFVPEYEKVSLRDIEFDLIEPLSVKVMAAPLERNLSNIEGLSNEDKTLNEGNIYYDIVFNALYPNESGRYMGMYINLELQQDISPGYEIETRGFYYAARRFSSQLRSIRSPSDYRKLKKVYSIWLCMGDDVPDKVSNTATLYNTIKNDIIGYIESDPSCYNLMDVVVIRLNGKNEVSDPVMELLRTIVDGTMGPKRKIEKLRELGIREDQSIEEEIREMGAFADAIERRALNKGIDQGYAQGMDNESRLFAQLYKVLNDQGKKDELERAVFDLEYKKQLYRIYGIK